MGLRHFSQCIYESAYWELYNKFTDKLEQPKKGNFKISLSFYCND